MTIKAVLRNGLIQPLEPLPPEWNDGQELVVDEPVADGAADINAWSGELDAATAGLPADEHDRFRRALAELETESKEAVRREWGLP
jgi:hypothetical protein